MAVHSAHHSLGDDDDGGGIVGDDDGDDDSGCQHHPPICHCSFVSIVFARDSHEIQLGFSSLHLPPILMSLVSLGVYACCVRSVSR